MVGRPIQRARNYEPAPGARGYKWKDAEPGNFLNLRSGIWSKRMVDPVAVELVAGLLEDRPEFERFPETVAAWSRAEARCVLLSDWIAEHGLVDAEGKPSVQLRFVAQFERLAMDLRSKLGLDPRSELELVREQAEAQHASFDVAALIAKGREVLEARAAAEVVPGVGVVSPPAALDEGPEDAA